MTDTPEEERNLGHLLATGQGRDPQGAPNVPLPTCPSCQEPLDDLPCDGALHRLTWGKKARDGDILDAARRVLVRHGHNIGASCTTACQRDHTPKPR